MKNNLLTVHILVDKNGYTKAWANNTAISVRLLDLNNMDDDEYEAETLEEFKRFSDTGREQSDEEEFLGGEAEAHLEFWQGCRGLLDSMYEDAISYLKANGVEVDHDLPLHQIIDKCAMVEVEAAINELKDDATDEQCDAYIRRNITLAGGVYDWGGVDFLGGDGPIFDVKGEDIAVATGKFSIQIGDSTIELEEISAIGMSASKARVGEEGLEFYFPRLRVWMSPPIDYKDVVTYMK